RPSHALKLAGVDVLAEEVDRRILKPRRDQPFVEGPCLVPVLDEREVVLPVPLEVAVYRRRPDRLAVDEHERPRRIGLDDVPPLDAAGEPAHAYGYHEPETHAPDHDH